MFEREIDRVRKELRTLLMPSQPHLAISDILENDRLSEPYKTYIKAEVKWWVHEERMIRQAQPRFNTAHPDFQGVIRELDSLCSQHARFDHEELNATIDAAVRTRVNHLCRPRTTIKWFIFRGEPTRSIREILLRFDYLYHYSYIRDGFLSWVKARDSDRTQMDLISVVEFERIIEKIDNDAILDLSQPDFVDLMEPIYEFFAEANPEIPPETVPTEAVIVFLDDKGAIPISQELERLLYREELKFLPRGRLLAVIDDVVAALDSEGAAYAPPVDQEIAPTSTPVPSEAIPVIANVINQQPPTEAEESPSVSSDKSKISEKRIDAFNTIVDQRGRERIIKRLFSGDQDAYDVALQELVSCSKWKEAAVTLDRIYARLGTEPNTATAMEFAQSIHRTYYMV